MQPPPPAYDGGNTAPPPPAYGGGTGAAINNNSSSSQATVPKVYWVYWGVLFSTVLTWIFAVVAAANDELLSAEGTTFFAFTDSCETDVGDVCDVFEAAKAFQYIATILISVIMVGAFVAAFMPTPLTGKAGNILGISLVVYSIFQLIAFSLMVDFAKQWDEDLTFQAGHVEAGPNVPLAIMAWIFGTIDAIVTLWLLRRAAADHDGPFRRCMLTVNVSTAGAPAAAPAPGVVAGPPSAHATAKV